MSPFRGRRRCLAFIPAAMSAAMLGGWTSSVSASPGFLGKYDFAHPMFLQGTVVGIEPTLPRAPTPSVAGILVTPSSSVGSSRYPTTVGTTATTAAFVAVTVEFGATA